MAMSEGDRRLWIECSYYNNLTSDEFERLSDKMIKDITVDEAKRLQKKRIEEEEAYEQGANDAWELAKKVFDDPLRGGFTKDELYNIFNVGYTSAVMADWVGIDAVKKYHKYEEKKKNEINVGDEVCLSETSTRLVVTKVYRDGGTFDALGYDGTTQSGLTLNVWKKTGQRCEIEFKKTCEKGEN